MGDFLESMKRIGAAIGNATLNVLSCAAIMIDHAYRAMDGLQALASRYDWFLTPSIDFYVIVTLAAEAGTPQASQHTIYRHLRDHLRADNWREMRRIVEEMRAYSIVTPERHKIIRDAFTALQIHGQRGFNAVNLIVPTLFAQIDGIIGEFAREVGISKWSNRRTDGPDRLRAEFDRVTHAFDEPALDLIFGVLFAESYLPGKRKLNRHRILHGHWLRYGSVENALRSFLILDFLGYIIEEHRQRRLAGDFSIPVTDKAQLSHMYSENFVKDIAPFAMERLRTQMPAFEFNTSTKEMRSLTGESATGMIEPLYEILVDGADPTIASASTLIETWERNVPDIAARVLDLQPGQEITVFVTPKVVARRLR